ncbi:MAG: L,D-transpeptidase family protein [Sphingomicrobium sp.]
MTRTAVTILVLCVAATSVPAASSLSSATREHAAAGPVLSLAAAAPKNRAAAEAEAPSLPLRGRVFLTAEQVRDAYASGLVIAPVKSILKIDAPMSYGDFVWNEKGVPPGRVWIRVDLKSQILSVFRAGHEIGTAVILYGTDGLPTPTGKFPILAKMKDHRSVTYGDAPMPYTLRLTNDGVSIHGSNVRWGFATHGCVGVPRDFAARMFDVVSRGDEVLIVSGKAAAPEG